MTVIIIDDVLDSIIRCCDFCSLLSLVRVSSRINALAHPHLLHYVSFNKDLVQLVSFLDLIIQSGNQQQCGASDSGLGRHLRHLEITSNALAQNRHYWQITDSMSVDEVLACTEFTETVPLSTWAVKLTSALRFMPNLRGFLFGGYDASLAQLEEVVEKSPQFISTLLACHHLKTIVLAGVGKGTSALLVQACRTLSPTFQPQSLSFSGALDRYVGRDEPPPPRISPEDGLGLFLRQDHIRNHITSLYLHHFDLSAFSSLHHREYRTILCPALVKVELSECDFPLSWLAAVAPNLRTLSIWGYSHIQTPLDAPLRKVLFPRLERINTFFHHLLTLKRSNAVALDNLRHLCLYSGWGHVLEQGTAEPFEVARAASNLKSLAFSPPSLPDIGWWKEFGAVLSLSSRSLKFLKLTLYSLKSAAQVKIFVSTVSWAPPVCVTVRLTIPISSPYSITQCFEIPDALADLPLEYVSLTFHGWHTDDYLNRLPELADESFIPIAWAKRIPTLRYVDVQLGYERKDLQSWMVEREHGRTAPAENVRVYPLDHGIAMKTREAYRAC
jgi:hypothetical protein